MNFAVIKTGGKQYKVAEDDVLVIEKLKSSQPHLQPVEGGQNGKVEFSEVLLVADGEEVKIGKPYLDGAKVQADIVEEGKMKKKMVFRFKSKTRYHKKKGHRQQFTKIKITKISA